MKIECSVEELKELIQNNTPVAGTTDVTIKLDGKKIGQLIRPSISKKCINPYAD